MNSHFQVCRSDSVPLLPQRPAEFSEADIFATWKTFFKNYYFDYRFIKGIKVKDKSQFILNLEEKCYFQICPYNLPQVIMGCYFYGNMLTWQWLNITRTEIKTMGTPKVTMVTPQNHCRPTPRSGSLLFLATWLHLCLEWHIMNQWQNKTTWQRSSHAN